MNESLAVYREVVGSALWLRAGLVFFSVFTFVLLWLVNQNWAAWVIALKIILTSMMFSATFAFWSLRIRLTDHFIEIKYGYLGGRIRYTNIEGFEIRAVHPLFTGLGLGTRLVIEEGGGYGYLARGGPALVLTLRKTHRWFHKVWVSTRKPRELTKALTHMLPDIRIIRHGYGRLEKEVSEEESKELYERLLYVYATIYGGGKPGLELEIESLIEQGLRREEAIYRLAEKERLIERE